MLGRLGIRRHRSPPNSHVGIRRLRNGMARCYLRRGYTDVEVKKVLGLNILRVMREVERSAVRIQRARGPSTATIEELRQ